MGKKFDLAELISGQNPGVSGSDTSREQITYIPFGDIIPDKHNGYSMDGLEELARSIEIAGLQQPLRVRPIPEEPGHYRIVSGHRRHGAIYILIKQGSEQFLGGVPCIVDAGTASPALRELQLLLGNADNRKLTSADQEQQAERISDCLRRLEDEGYEFPGRHRDWVSKLSGLSRTKLARLKVIREKLEKSIKRAYYDKGTLGESSAYALARLPEDAQRRIVDWYRARNSGGTDKNGLRYLYENTIESYARDLARVQTLTCPEKLGGGECLNRAGILEHLWRGSYRSYAGTCAGKSCCFTCGELASCKNVCPKMAEKAKTEKANRREATRAEKAAREQEEAAPKEWVRNVWQRFGSALSRAGLEEKNVESIRRIYQIPSDEVKALEAGESTKIRADMCLPFSNSSYRHDFEDLIALADRLDVSIDYLLCRSDDPGRGDGVASEAGERNATGGNTVLTMTGDGEGQAEPYWRPFPKVKPKAGQQGFVQQESSGPGYFSEARLAKWDGKVWTWVSSDAGISEIEVSRVIRWLPEPADPVETEDDDAEEDNP